MMAAAELKPEVTCSICTDIFTDPVTLGCGHSFCKICITRTFDNQHDREYFCPECMKDFRRRPELKKNPRLSNIADHFHSVEPKRHKPEHVCSYCVKLHVPAVTLCLHCEAFLCDVHKQAHSKSPEHVLTDPTTSLEDRKCPVHKKVLEYYCIDDGTCICVYCLASDHNGHRLSTISEFFQQKTKNLEPILDKLSSKRVETEKKLQSLQDHKRKIDNEADGVAEKVTSIMRDIRRKQEDLEKRVRAEISSQQQQISLSVSNDIQQLEKEKTELNKKITEIEELSRSTNPISALQTPEMLICVSEDEYDLDKGVASTMIRKGGDLKEDVIFETLHSGLSNIVEGTNVYVKDVQKVSLSAADDNIHIGSSSVSNKLQVEVPVFTYGPIAPVWSHTPLKTQVQAITTKPQNALLNAGGCQNIPLVAAKPLRIPTVEAEPQNIPAIAAEAQNVPFSAAEPQNLPFSAAESQNISLIEAEPQNIHLVAAEPQNVPLVAAEPQNIPLVEAKPLRVPTVESEPQNIPAIAAEAQNLPFSADESQNISLIEAEPQNIQLVAAEPQNVSLVAAEHQNVLLIAVAPQNDTVVIAAESQNIPLVAAEPQNVPLIAAEPQNSSLIQAEPQNIPLVAAEPQNVPLVAEPQNVPLIAAEPQNIPLVAAKPLRVLTVEVEPQNIPAISAEPQNLPLSAAESQNISVMEAEPQNVPLILGNSSTTQEILLGVNTASNYLLTYDDMDDDTNDDTENYTDDDFADYLENYDDDNSENDIDDDSENDIDDDSENDIDKLIDKDTEDDLENENYTGSETEKDTNDETENDTDDDFGC
ncbi:E3 ubiquitin/ISG15 ligase TRIM25-like [Rana temporaria]|uniref:E3 ubiquitin/ISG15 ligase TRIM25-like n=1 Tax=Rana temporaria TaxID=8407 RepID=UPI001AAC85FE|nr:E3 ubiquitin/ISG15 ligase TRIM25-like [Rana temporaria]